jgi:hypothetical protein
MWSAAYKWYVCRQISKAHYFFQATKLRKALEYSSPFSYLQFEVIKNPASVLFICFTRTDNCNSGVCTTWLWRQIFWLHHVDPSAYRELHWHHGSGVVMSTCTKPIRFLGLIFNSFRYRNETSCFILTSLWTKWKYKQIRSKTTKK